MIAVLPIPFEHISAIAFDAREGVLIDLNAKRYYQLNETAMLVWSCLEQRLSREEAVRRLTEHFDVSGEQATASVERLVQELKDRRLIHSS